MRSVSLRPSASGVGIVPYSLLICLGVASAADVRVLGAGRMGARYTPWRSPVARRGDLDDAIRVSTYLACADLAATAGIILSAYVGYVDPKIGGNYNLESIAAAVLGGVAFTGGQGGALGALAGAVFLLGLLNVVTLSSLNPFMQLIVQGVVMLVAVSAFQLLNKRTAT